MSELDPDENFEKRTKALFDDSVESVNGNIRSRLTQARHQALEEASKQRISRRIWIPLAGMATAAAVTALVVLPQMHQKRGAPEAFASADDMAILLNSEDLEMLEDMEFYAWLDSDADDSSDDSSGTDGDARS
ncbi:MAG: hypothetical protein ACJ8MR_17360 [Povalibacter sp.]